MKADQEPVNPKAVKALEEFLERAQFFDKSMKAFTNAFNKILADESIQLSPDDRAKLEDFLKPYQELAKNNFATNHFANITPPSEDFHTSLEEVISTIENNKEYIDNMFGNFETGVMTAPEFEQLMKEIQEKNPALNLDKRLTEEGLEIGVLKKEQLDVRETSTLVFNPKTNTTRTVEVDPKNPKKGLKEGEMRIMVDPKTGEPVTEKTRLRDEVSKPFQAPMRVVMPLKEVVERGINNERLNTVISGLDARIVILNESKREQERQQAEQQLLAMQQQASPKPKTKQKRSFSTLNLFKSMGIRKKNSSLILTPSSSPKSSPPQSPPEKRVKISESPEILRAEISNSKYREKQEKSPSSIRSVKKNRRKKEEGISTPSPLRPGRK